MFKILGGMYLEKYGNRTYFPLVAKLKQEDRNSDLRVSVYTHHWLAGHLAQTLFSQVLFPGWSRMRELIIVCIISESSESSHHKYKMISERQRIWG